MKITKRQLRSIIKEAITTVSDAEFDRATWDDIEPIWQEIDKSVD